ncbi:MAG: selenide, water dikinase SelD [Pirellulales bacterium]|nr:selenide, water dikinase SelD [Pirellulales bacterium]
MNPSEFPSTNIVLLGIGHTNAHVVRKWRMSPIAGARLTCVSDFGTATYSGMLPGRLAGQYDRTQMEIDLVRFCAAAGARLIREEVIGLDLAKHQLLFAERPPICFDALSIGVGSRPKALPGANGAVVAIKPMQTFFERLDVRLKKLAERTSKTPLRIVIAGAGAGGTEIAFCLPNYLRSHGRSSGHEITVVGRNKDIPNGMSQSVCRMVRRELTRRSVAVMLDRRIESIDSTGHIVLDNGQQLFADIVLVATSAEGVSLFGHLGLPTDERGFLRTRETLQSVAAERIFAVGDAGSCEANPRPKAGIFAVRQGPVLWQNITRLIHGRRLLRWKPQRSFLALLNTGDKGAILSYRGISLRGGWCWRLKDSIDRRFMAKYQDYERRTMAERPTTLGPPEVPQCGGCGCKVPASLLSRVLERLENPTPPHVLLGLEGRDDVAVLENSPTAATALSTDFFTPPLEDPYLAGKIAALNALSDFYAKAIEPRAALALVTVPHGSGAQQEEFLSHLLAGSLAVLRPLNVPIVGGHTTEGPQAMIGFTILGETRQDTIPAKGGLQPGDYLILTKPLGTGILLAAHMRALCEAPWMDALLKSMLTSNRAAAKVAEKLHLTAATDVTGFGLAGHLLEMLSAANVAAQISLDGLPLLPGVLELAEAGIQSTLAPANREVERSLEVAESVRSRACYKVLFDPQTSGGLLLGAASSQVAKIQHELDGAAHVLGPVVAAEKGKPLLHIR